MLFWAIVILGGGGYLLMEHPLIFWLVAFPLAIVSIAGYIGWLKK